MIIEKGEFPAENLIFHQLVGGPSNQHIRDLYFAIQSALHFGVDYIDVGEYLAGVFPQGRRSPAPDCPMYSGACLAHFSYLYSFTFKWEVLHGYEQAPTPEDDTESCSFFSEIAVPWVRRHDRKTVTVKMKIFLPLFAARFARRKRLLDRMRAKVLIKMLYKDKRSTG